MGLLAAAIIYLSTPGFFDLYYEVPPITIRCCQSKIVYIVEAKK